MPKSTGSNRVNFERTRTLLIAAARECFTKNGFHTTSTTMIIEIAGSSRGSMYYHFADKKELFKAVFDSLLIEMNNLILNYPYQGISSIDDLVDGCVAYLKVFTDEVFARIVLIDAPHVLGIDYCRSRDAETCYKALLDGIAAIVKDPETSLLLTDFLSGALDTYALRIALSKQRDNTFDLYSRSFKKIFYKIFTDLSPS